LKNHIVKPAKKLVLFLLPIFIFTTGLNLYGQTPSEEITVVAPYEPTISDAFKINIPPRLKDNKTIKPDFSYNIDARRINTPFQLDPIVPAKIVGEPITKLYKNFVKLGMGTYTTPYFEFFANKLRSKNSAYGVHLKHLSSTGKIKDYAYSGFSENEVDIFAKKFFMKHTLSGKVFYKRNVVHYFGFKPDDFPELDLSKDDLKQRFSLIGANADIHSTFITGTQLNHSFSVDYYYLQDLFETAEHNIDFRMGLDKPVNIISAAQKQNLGLKTYVDYFHNEDSLFYNDNAVINFNPYYDLHINEYSLHVGLNAAIEADTTADMYFYPVVRGEVEVVKNVLKGYAGITGELSKNNFKQFSEENPFVSSMIPMKYMYTKFKSFGGIKGSIGRETDYNIRISGAEIDQMPFFVNDTLSGINSGLDNQFTVVYDDIKMIHAAAELSYQKMEKIRINLAFNYYQYTMDKELEAWHKPEYKASLGIEYNIADKIIAKSDIIGNSSIYAKTYENGEVVPKKLDGWLDLNLGFEYRYTKILSAFLNFNNISNSRYFRWNEYPSQKFSILGGITYSF